MSFLLLLIDFCRYHAISDGLYYLRITLCLLVQRDNLLSVNLFPYFYFSSFFCVRPLFCMNIPPRSVSWVKLYRTPAAFMPPENIVSGTFNVSIIFLASYHYSCSLSRCLLLRRCGQLCRFDCLVCNQRCFCNYLYRIRYHGEEANGRKLNENKNHPGEQSSGW